MKPTRAEFLAGCRALIGAPYLFGGNGDAQWISPTKRQPLTIPAFDCKGYLLWVVKQLGGPDLRWTHNADSLWLELEPTEDPRPGDFAFWGAATRASHIAACLAGRHEAVIEAGGGGRTTLTLQDAVKDNARVRISSSPLYRADLLGFRRNPWVRD